MYYNPIPMPSATLHGDTQVLDLDSPRSANDDSECGSCDHFLSGDTLPNEYEETEQLYDSFEDDAAGVEYWGETQLLDEPEESAVQEIDVVEVEPVTEKTNLPSNVEKLVDGFGCEGGSGFGTEDGKLVDADASTDGGEDCDGDRPAVKSFGFAAAPSRTSIMIDKLEPNLDEESYKRNQGKAENSRIEMKSNWMNAFPTGVTDPIFVGTKDDEIVLDHEIDELETRLTKLEVKKPCDENARFLDVETAIRQSAAGLSYISSQEPGIDSQNNALCVVDEFLSVNVLGFSQDDDVGKANVLKSPPTASLNRPQCFARVSDRSSDGNLQVYEWIDCLENDRGGKLSNHKKGSFFDDKEGKPSSHSRPSVVILGDPEMVTGEVSKSNTKGSKSRTLQRLALTCSGPQLKNIDAEKHISEARFGKKLFNEMKKQSVTEAEQLEKSEVDNTFEVYDVGPATQMAAEAIQALCYGALVNEQLHLPPNNEKLTGAVVGKSKKTRSQKNPNQKRSYRSPTVNSNMSRSKHQNSIYSKSRAEQCNSFKKGFTDLSMNRGLEESTVGMTAKMKMKKKSKEKAKEVSTPENRDFTASIVGEVEQNATNCFIQEIVMPPNLVPSRQPSVNERCNVGTSNIYTSPIACRTRHSKAAKQSKLQTIDNHKDASMVDSCVRMRRTVKSLNELVLNASEGSEVHECGYTGLNRTDPDIRPSSHSDIGCKASLISEETGAFHNKDTNRKPKRRKMEHVVSENKMCNSNMDNSSKLVDVISSKIVDPTFKKIKQGLLTRSIAEILDTAKRKKRSASYNSKFEFESNGGKMQKSSGMRWRSSMLTDLLNPHTSNQKDKLASERTTYTCSVSSMKQNVDPDSDKTDSSNSKMLAEVVPEKLKTERLSNGGQPSLLVSGFAGQQKGSHNGKGQSIHEGSSYVKGQPNLPCSPKMDTSTVTTIYFSQDTSSVTCAKSLSRSSARELFRLEANEITKRWKLKDLRTKKDMSSFQVCFSQHLGKDAIKQQKKILSRLGIHVVSSSLEATHFVADKFVRTRNMLEAIAMGKPVVTTMWLESCGQASCYIDEKNYILRDAKKEKEIGFNMPDSLARACQYPLLQGKRVFITPETKPSQDLIYSIITAAQGQPLKQLERSITREDKLPEDLLIISSEGDFAACVPFLEKGAEVFSSELLLNGIVVQKLEYARHRLFLDHVKKTRSTVWLRAEDGEQFLPVKRRR